MLSRKGWEGDKTCKFCHQIEIVDHLFLNCTIAQQIWVWMRESQEYFKHRTSLHDIFEFATTLPKYQQQAFFNSF